MKEMDEQLGALKECVLRMALMAETMLHRTIQALVLRDNSKAHKLDDLENSVNKLQIEIDQRGANILALRQPMANDLRFIIATMKIASDIERIADQAINISENVEVLMKLPGHELLPDLLRMADLTQQMVEETFQSPRRGGYGQRPQNCFAR